METRAAGTRILTGVPYSAALLDTDAAVVRSLLEGEGIIDVRPAAAPLPPGTRFWLGAGGPPATLKPAYEALAGMGAASRAQAEIVAGWVELAGSATVHLDAKAVEALDGKTVIALGALFGTEVRVLALRAHRLATPLTADALPPDPGAAAGEPALSDGAFEAKLGSVVEAVPGFTR